MRSSKFHAVPEPGTGSKFPLKGTGTGTITSARTLAGLKPRPETGVRRRNQCVVPSFDEVQMDESRALTVTDLVTKNQPRANTQKPISNIHDNATKTPNVDFDLVISGERGTTEFARTSRAIANAYAAIVGKEQP